MPHRAAIRGVDLETTAQGVARSFVEQMPPAHEFERGVGGGEAARIEHSDQTSVTNKHVRGDQVAVRHDIGGLPWQGTERLPQRRQCAGS